ncbi:class I SAM-dependent methyltransferase [Sediminitomix flava]|uniref:Methyltransferase family protein n=1 Tax=Sediminitomix flava TaxID=379075 RepID=A0A315ZBD2_SEDFL|nr:class I SAM-dependent methyltransferase [Sediminitomix flava]PWJ42885.1 methyltransferase family protein [Sediminitomix flava]
MPHSQNMIHSNDWNKMRYTLLEPLYDWVASYFSTQRKRSIDMLAPEPNDKILILGAGTGLDLPYLKNQNDITAIDITPAMLNKLRKRANDLKVDVNIKLMDGHHLDFPDKHFDAVILHLIIAVIPDPVRCIQEVERVLKPGGHVMIFDKFLPDHEVPSQGRKILNMVTSVVFSDINRQVGNILSSTNLKIEENQNGGFNGVFRIIKLQKPSEFIEMSSD